ncbi:asparagine synthase (glutamine-hydrolyzing) [Streptomyces griseorubiginosus]|uniref:asparagine synthase (glutamine-hydrolyzing) n=1 Tax=Streptomyces griseorubiginosus TaxID=67304 RepID=UPI00339E16EF
MCRIYGSLGMQLTAEQLRGASELMRHGGPDQHSAVREKTWALGSNRLAIMDPQGGRQPFVLGDPDGNITVVYNGELYNHHQLRTRLERHGYRFPDRCDGSLLPALYHLYGDTFTDHLDGMYALAVIDTRAEPRLLLATDHAGMKPLYYHWNRRADALCFASELPALLAFPGVPRHRWEAGLDVYLTTKTPFGEQTMIEGVRVLPPATTAVFTRRDGLRIRRRTTAPSPSPPVLPQPSPSLEESGATVLHELTSAAELLAEADAPLCAITSGGLDSGLVTALLAERVRPLHTFTIGYRGTWPFDERVFAREIAERYGTIHHQVEADPREFPALLGETVRHLGQPNADPITLSTLVLFRAVHQAGFKVAVTGDAADEAFGGYDRIRQALGAGPNWARDYVRALAAVPRPLRDRLYTDEYRAALQRMPSEHSRLHGLLHAPHRTRLDVITEFELTERLPAYHLRRVDHLSMASSVEVRLPYCQRGVTALASRLPAATRVSDGHGKRVLYAAARGLLPPSVLCRPKQPFTLPVTAMLTARSPLMEHAREVLCTAELKRDGRLDATAVGRLLDRQAERPDDVTALAVWSLLVHQHWLDQLDGLGTSADARAAAGAGV